MSVIYKFNLCLGIYLLLSVLVTPIEAGLLDGITSLNNLGGNNYYPTTNQQFNNPLQPILNSKSNLVNLASLTGTYNKFSNLINQRPNTGSVNSPNNKEQILAESQSLIERLQVLNRQKQNANNQGPIDGKNANLNADDYNRYPILAEGQKLLERLQELNRLKEQNQNNMNTQGAVNNNYNDVPQAIVPKPVKTDEISQTSKDTLKELSTRKFYFQMKPIVPEGEETNFKQIIYYLDSEK